MVDDASLAREDAFGQAADGVLSRPRTLWALAALAMALDVLITGVGLSLGLAERNPLANAAIDAVGLFRAGVLLKGASLAVGYTAWRLLPRMRTTSTDQLRNLVPIGVAIPSWIAVGINTSLVVSIL
ncbi:MAG: hypothetical protein ACOCQV_01300 [Halolamina sp.]